MIVETSKGKLPISYTWNALAKFGDMTGKSMNDVMALDLPNMSVTDVLKFLLCGFIEGARKAGEECKIKTIEDVGDLMDDNPDLLNQAIESITSKFSEEGDKKK